METDYFLDILDPYQCDRIPLSDVIKLFTSHKVEIMDQQACKTFTQTSLAIPAVEGESFRAHNNSNFQARNSAVAGDTTAILPAYKRSDSSSRGSKRHILPNNQPDCTQPAQILQSENPRGTIEILT